jgi:hypothetical protein
MLRSEAPVLRRGKDRNEIHSIKTKTCRRIVVVRIQIAVKVF